MYNSIALNFFRLSVRVVDVFLKKDGGGGKGIDVEFGGLNWRWIWVTVECSARQDGCEAVR